MPLSIIYPAKGYGRGNFATNAQLGGTLDPKGIGPGPYFRAPASHQFKDMPGSIAVMALRKNIPCSINDYAVYMGVRAIQRVIGVEDDGVFGDDSDKAGREFQKKNKLTIDGVLGPTSCRLMFEPLVVSIVDRLKNSGVTLLMMSKGHMLVESNYDPASVGEYDPQDLGPGLNGTHNPEMSAEFRLTPEKAIPAMVKIVAGNLIMLKGDIDSAILAYNIGRSGARDWVEANRPSRFLGVDTFAYINKVKNSK